MHEEGSKVDEDAQAFYRLLKNAEQMLYPRTFPYKMLKGWTKK